MAKTKSGIESVYSGGITREQFLFYETRTVARLMVDEGLDDKEIIAKVVEENLFQNPTERMLKNLSSVCLKRLRALDNMQLVEAIAHQPQDVAKQICLYAMMKQYRLVWDFMLTVIGEKYRQQDLSYGKMDLNVFFMRLQEQDDGVASWSDSTIKKIQQVLNRILVENEYIESHRSVQLNPVMISSVLEAGIRENGDSIALPAFNCFW